MNKKLQISKKSIEHINFNENLYSSIMVDNIVKYIEYALLDKDKFACFYNVTILRILIYVLSVCLFVFIRLYN